MLRAGEAALRTDTGSGGFAIREEAPQQNHLTDADHQQNDSLADGPEGHSGVKVLSPAAALSLSQTEMGLVVNHRLQCLMNGYACRFHLCEGGDSVLVGEEGRIISDLKVKVYSLVGECGEFVAETKLEGAVLGGCKCEAVILLFHLFIKHSSVRVLQAAVDIVMPPGNDLKLQCTFRANDDVFIETLLCIVRKLECELRSKHQSTK